VAHFAHHLLTALPGPLLPFIRSDFGLNYAQSSFVTSSFTFSNGIGQLPAGWLADRVGPRILITVGILGVAIAGFLVGISPTYLMMLVFLVLMGLFAGGYHPAATPLISASVEPDKMGRALGFHLIGGNASFFLAPLIAAAIAAAWSWRGSFISLAVPSAIFGVVFFLFLSRRAGIGQARARTTDSRSEAPPAPGRWRRLAAFMALTVLGGGMGMSIMAFVPLYLVDQFGVSKQTAASLLSIVNFAGLWAGPVGGYISDRIGRVRIIIACGLISGILVYALKLVPWGLGFGAVLFLIGINNSLRMPVSEAFIIGQTTARSRSTIYGIYYFAMQETSAVFAPIMGSLIDNLGFPTCFTIASSAGIAVTLICSVFLWGAQN